MPEIRILHNVVPVAFETGQDATIAMDQEALMEGLQAMAAAIQAVDWPQPYADAFDGLKGIVFFEGKVMVNGYLMERPCMDEDDGVFYWESNEFTANTDPAVHAHTLFHDCWHIVQFKRDGGFARSEPERVGREIEAIGNQLKVARLLNCDQRYIQFLIDFEDSQQRIKDRLAEGVDFGSVRHA